MSDVDDEFNDDIDMPEPSMNPEYGASSGGEGGDGKDSNGAQEQRKEQPQELPQLSRKDKTLQEVLEMMEGEFAPIIPDAVTEYYLSKNGFSN